MNQMTITHLIAQSFKNTIGKGPDLIKVNIINNTILVDLKGGLTTLESNLLNESNENLILIKAIRHKLRKLFIKKVLSQLRLEMDCPDLALLNYCIKYDWQEELHSIIFTFNKQISIENAKRFN